MTDQDKLNRCRTFANADDIDWLIERATKYQKLYDTWMNGIEDTSYETIQFLRVCKEVIEDFKPDYKTPMT